MPALAHPDYVEQLRAWIRERHGADATHLQSVPVEDRFCGQTVWKGIVEVFALTNHHQAKRAYAWSQGSGRNDSEPRFVVVLEVPPVASPESAVRFAVTRTAEVEGQLLCMNGPRRYDEPNGSRAHPR